MKRQAPRPGAVDGLNAADPGLQLAATVARQSDAHGVISVCSGDIPGLRAAVRVILDEREREHSDSRVLEITDAAARTERPDASLAVVWPRAHLGKDFAQQMLARAGLMLPLGGQVVCSVRKQKGAGSLMDFMGELFGNVRVRERNKGYRLLQSDRTKAFNRPRAHELLALRYRYEDAVLGDLVLEAAPGVFSRRSLDEGTRCLIDHASSLPLQPAKVLDLCAGVGPLVCWALRRWPAARGLAVESNLVAAQLAKDNADRNGLTERVAVERRVGLPSVAPEYRAFGGQVDLALINPPTHADAGTLATLLGPLATWMRPGAPALLVAARAEGVAKALSSAGAEVSLHPYARFTVLEARWPAP